MKYQENDLKRIVGEYAVKKFITNHMTIGLGSGTTAVWATRALSERYASGELQNIYCAVTGPGTKLEALSNKLPVYDLNHPSLLHIDVVIDGADEFDIHGNLVKGGGGCLLQEKIVGYSAKKFIILVHENKQVEHLGISYPLPIEVIPSALTRVETQLCTQYKIDNITLRKDGRNIGPWITEEGNYLLDVTLGQKYAPTELEQAIIQIVGVVEVGLFTRNKPILVIIKQDGSIHTLE